MINVKRQINYWKSGAEDDFKSAQVLIEQNRLLHGLFFCHLILEKATKAHVVKATKEVPPRSHNLIFLSEKANLIFNDDDDTFLGILMKYQLQGRYPDYNPKVPGKSKALEYLNRTKSVLEWLNKKL